MNASTFLSFQGRLGPGPFITASLILIVVGVVLNLLPVVGVSTGLLTVISIVLIWPWLAVWVKRLHDAGKTGWLILLIAVVWLVLQLIVGAIFTGMFVDTSATQEQINAAAASGDFGAVFALSGELGRQTAVPNAILSAIVSVIVVFAANAMLKSDLAENKYGPPTTAI